MFHQSVFDTIILAVRAFWADQLGGSKEGEGEGDKDVLTEEKVKTLIQEGLNATAANLRKDLQKTGKKSEDAIAAFSTSLEELKTALEKPPDDPDPDPEGKKIPPEIRAQLDKSEKEIEKLKKQNQEEREAREVTERKSAETQRKNAVYEEIDKQSLRQGHREVAYRYVQDDVRLDDEGNLVGGPEGEEVPLEDYIKTFFEGDLGASFLKPSDSGGSGNNAGGRRGKGGIQLESIGPNMSDEDRAQAYAEVGRLAQLAREEQG